MSLNNGARVKKLQPGIYRSCDKPFDEYDDGEILRYVEVDRVWTHLVFFWESFVRVKHHLYSKGMYDYLQDEDGSWIY